MGPLDQYDPETLQNIIVNIQSRLTAVERRFVKANKASELVEDGGNLSSVTVGESTQDEDGFHTSADLVDIDWWQPLALAFNDVTTVRVAVIRTIGGVKYLYVGGLFANIGEVLARNIARYNYTTRSWEEVGGGVNGTVFAIAFDSSDVLHIGGTFTDAGGDANADRIAKLSSGAWVNVGGSLNGTVYSIAFDSADRLVIGGAFTNAGGDPLADYVAELSGGAWVNVQGGVNADVFSVQFDSLDVLHIAGQFTSYGGDPAVSRIAKEGVGFVSVGGGIDNGTVYTIKFDNQGNLHIGGSFINAGGDASADGVAKLVDGLWTGLGNGSSATVYAIAFDELDTIHVGGTFVNYGGDATADGIAKLVEGEWKGISNGGGISGLAGHVYALAYDSGNVIAGGDFDTAGAIQCSSLAIYTKLLSDAIDLDTSMLELYAGRYNSGWLLASETWTYVSATTFTVKGDKTNLFRAGAKLKFVNTTAKTAYVSDATYSAATNLTTITVVAQSANLANAAFTSTYVSYSEYPEGWPHKPFGTYTPTATIVTNVAAVQTFLTQWSRVGNIATLSGKIEIDPTAIGAVEVEIDMPIASNFANEQNAGGTFWTHTDAGSGGNILASAANDRLRFRGNLVSASNRTFGFIAQYQILT